MKNSKEALDRLRKLTDRQATLFEIAKLVREVTKRSLWVGRDTSVVDWLKKAATVTGYTPGTLRRMVHVVEFVELISCKEGVPTKHGKSIPVSALEVLKRMYNVSPEKARDLFSKVMNGEISFRAVRSEYDKQVQRRVQRVDSAVLGPRLARLFNDTARTALINNIHLFTDDRDVKFYWEPPLWKYLSPDAIAFKVKNDTFEFVDAFYTLPAMQFEKNPRQLLDMLVRTGFLSRFFRRFWVVMPHDLGIKIAEPLCRQFTLLGDRSVGIVTLSEHEDPSKNTPVLTFALRPSGPPVLDLRALYLTHLKNNLEIITRD